MFVYVSACILRAQWVCTRTHRTLVMVCDGLIDFCQKIKQAQAAPRQQVEISVNGRAAKPDSTGTPGVSIALLRSGNKCVYVCVLHAEHTQTNRVTRA